MDQLRPAIAVVTGQQVAALRASLTFDMAQAQEWRARLIQSGDLRGFGELVYAAFLLAVRRYFAPVWTRADVVRYVGSVRARGPADDDVDPVIAEMLILRALGADPPLRAAEEAKAEAQAIMLGALISDLGLDAAGLDEFLAEARALADRWLSGPARQGQDADRRGNRTDFLRVSDAPEIPHSQP